MLSLWSLRDGEENLATSLRSMGEMGVGMELYFFMTRQLAMLFSVLTLVHLPALAWHARLLPCRAGGAESEACECAASVANKATTGAS